MAEDPNPFAPPQTPLGLGKGDRRRTGGCIIIGLIMLPALILSLFVAYEIANAIFRPME